MPSERDCFDMVERIENSLVVLHSSRAFYREYRSILESNPRLRVNNHFLSWVADNYLYGAMMSLRRLLDRKSGTISIFKLLDALQINNQLLTKTSYISRFIADGSDRELANLSFSMLAGSGQAAGLNLQVLRDEIVSFLPNWIRLKAYIDERIAHESRSPSGTLPTLSDLDKCITKIAEVMRKVICFMTCRDILFFEPVIQYPWREIFSFPWIEPPH